MTDLMGARSFESADGAQVPLADGAPLLLFRVGGELFAFDLRASEEALELPALEALPRMPNDMLGVFPLRDQLVPVYAPERRLGLPSGGMHGVVLIMRSGERRIGIAVEDVEDVITMDLSRMRRPLAGDAADTIVLGVMRRGTDLVAIVEPRRLVAACAGVSTGEDG